MTVGFERMRYSFAEPDAGTSLIRESICVTVTNGELGFPLIIVPQWTAVTATGEYVIYYHELYQLLSYIIILKIARHIMMIGIHKGSKLSLEL